MVRKDVPSGDYIIGWGRGVREYHEWLYDQERTERADLEEFIASRS